MRSDHTSYLYYNILLVCMFVCPYSVVGIYISGHFSPIKP